MPRRKTKTKYGPSHYAAAAAVAVLVFSGIFSYDVFTFGCLAPIPLRAQAAPAPTLPIAARIGIPIRLRIPSIGVDTTVESVTLAKDGSMGVPADPLDVGWYSLDARPGEPGSAVIDGHVNWWHGETGAFEHLHTVKVGDVITVEDDGGTETSFVVRGTREYAAAAQATDVFQSADGKAHLNLITCDGAWNKAAGQYDKRLVVFADLE